MAQQPPYSPNVVNQTVDYGGFRWKGNPGQGWTQVGVTGSPGTDTGLTGINFTAQNELLAKQKAEQQEFLGRYTTGLAEARKAAETELGLPQLREITQTAGQTARDVSRQVQAVPETQKTIAQQVGISAPRLALRTAAETAKLQPAAESARRALEDALAGQSFGETQYTQRLQETAQPFQLEASMLSESLAREMAGYSQERQNELSLTLQKMANGQALSLA